MRLTVQIDGDGAAFGDEPRVEFARILRVAAGAVVGLDPEEEGPLLDVNGNTRGSWRLERSLFDEPATAPLDTGPV